MDRKIRVARIIARLNVGGPAKHVVWLNAGLDPARFETTLITGRVPAGEEDMGWFATQNGVEPVVIGDMSRAISWRDLLVIWKLFRIFRRIRPDVIHTHTAKAGTAGRIAGLLYRLTTRTRPRFVHTFHGHVFHSYYGRFATNVFLFIERFLARFTDKIVVLSPKLRDEIHLTYRIGRAPQFAVIPLGLSLPTAPLAPSNRSPLVAGIVGRLTEIKDHDFFLRGVAAYDGDVRFHIIGDGHLRMQLEQRAAQLGLSSRVTFLGNRDDADAFYRQLDTVVLTSKNEGTPLTLIEAMSYGLPVVATAVGGVPDVVGARTGGDDRVMICERGVLIRHGDTEAFARAIAMLASDAQLRAALGANGRAFAVEHYDKARLVRDVAALYESIVLC